MGNKTGIEWTDATWNPIRGCSRVSKGCEHCYAERVAHRFSGEGQPYEGLTSIVNGHPAWNGRVKLVEEHLLDPLKWGLTVQSCPRCGAKKESACDCDSTYANRGTTERSRRIFVNSMSDLFHPNVPDEWIDRIFAVMALCPQHTFQVLTKRPERMLAYNSNDSTLRRLIAAAEDIARLLGGRATTLVYDNADGLSGVCLPNVQLGVSVEDQKTADERIPLLLQTPAAVRFISAEPLLGDINLKRWMYPMHWHWDSKFKTPEAAKAAGAYAELKPQGLVSASARFLDWVIVGGESGPGARPMHPDWARSLRDQCVAAGVPFFFKQWGEWLPWNCIDEIPEDSSSGVPVCLVKKDGRVIRPYCQLDAPGQQMVRVGKKAAGSLLDGVEWKEFPQ